MLTVQLFLITLFHKTPTTKAETISRFFESLKTSLNSTNSKPMPFIATIASRAATTIAYAVRIAVGRFGVTPVLVVALAAVAAILSLRRPRNTTRRGRPRPHIPNSDASVSPNLADSVGIVENVDRTTTSSATSASAATRPLLRRGNDTENNSLARRPPWLHRVRKVSIGTVCSFAEPCPLFLLKHVTNTAFQTDSNGAQSSNTLQNGASSLRTSPKVSLTTESIAPLKSFASMFELYVVVRVDDDEMEQAVTDAFKAAGLFDRGLMDPRKLLFCETDIGRISVARQLESQLHIDENKSVISDLQRFLPTVALVYPDARSASDVVGRNVVKYTSLSSFFAS